MCHLKSSETAKSLSTESTAVTHKKTHKEMVTMYIKLLAHASIYHMKRISQEENLIFPTIKHNLKIIHPKMKTRSKFMHPNTFH